MLRFLEGAAGCRRYIDEFSLSDLSTLHRFLMNVFCYLASTSVGVLAFILDCGTIISLSQLHGAESLTQVYMKALDLYQDNPDLPVLGYDDGCKCTLKCFIFITEYVYDISLAFDVATLQGHLRRFAELRQNLTEETQAFWVEHGQFIVVDRYHFRNHKRVTNTARIIVILIMLNQSKERTRKFASSPSDGFRGSNTA